MNIFVLDRDPKKAAIMQCDKHVVKMPVETAQMLASAMRRHGATDIDMPFTKAGTPYGNAHPHHPCTLWAGETQENYRWLVSHGLQLCEEFQNRYGKRHACCDAILHMAKFENYIPEGSLTTFAQAMPDESKCMNPVRAYREYYLTDKVGIASWNKGRRSPAWWKIAA